MTFEASPARVREDARMDVLAELDREFTDDRRDERIVLAAQQRMGARRRRIAHYCGQLGGTTMFARHHSEPAALPHVAVRLR